VQFIQDAIPKNEAGVLFKYRNKLLADNPEYIFMMRYKIISSFPLQALLAFHKGKEQQYVQT